MDVAYCRTTPGTQIISYIKKNPPRPNQLWRKEPYDKNTFYLVSKLHSSCKVTIKVIDCCIHLYLLLTSYLHGFNILQDGNARIASSGSRFREEGNGEFIMLVEVETGNALDVKGATTNPDTPVVALPMSGSSNQKWKYCIPMPFVSINYIHVLESLALCISTINFHQYESSSCTCQSHNGGQMENCPTIPFIDKAMKASPPIDA